MTKEKYTHEIIGFAEKFCRIHNNEKLEKPKPAVVVAQKNFTRIETALSKNKSKKAAH